MSEETTKQAVVEETDAQAKPAAEETSARDDDLDKLLSEFEEKPDQPKAETKSGSEKPKPETKPGADHDIGQVLQKLGTWEEERKAEKLAEANRQFRQDMDKTIKDVRGDLDAVTFDDVFVEAWLDARARGDKRLSSAWAERHNNPKQFQRIVEGLGREFAKKFSNLPDKQATEDREAVTAAVRGASTKAPESKPPDVRGMSDAEFREYTAKQFGFVPEV